MSDEIEKAIALCNAGHDTKTNIRHGIKKPNTKARKPFVEFLLLKYGPVCFYCGVAFDVSNLTLEHLLSRTYGGPNNVENMALACAPCNHEADSLSVIEKVILRESKRST